MMIENSVPQAAKNSLLKGSSCLARQAQDGPKSSKEQEKCDDEANANQQPDGEWEKNPKLLDLCNDLSSLTFSWLLSSTLIFEKSCT